ncbi:hypothetical protein HPB51_003810 [Rhipicephalus microplus]|uniref:TRAF-type domain-containing protein n=1 Tax=Rhipicephalus microplus TaxID=6941 RepID=A0A9J6EKG3_RHIMP|nr:hypothetical protein HPB51_003810 [Rhipicephalus microplus]
MYGSRGHKPVVVLGSDHIWERIGDAAAVGRQRHRYRVTGFGCHTEHQIVEFFEELFATRFCSWCGLVASNMCIVSCLHVICPACHQRVFVNSSGFATCPIDNETLPVCITVVMANNVCSKLVHCPSKGCDYTGCLKDLNDHLDQNCAFHLTACTKCDASVAHKDLRSHFLTCEGAPGAFLEVPDVQSLLESLDNARKELDSVTGCPMSARPLENAVVSLTRLLDKLRGRLGVEEDV